MYSFAVTCCHFSNNLMSKSREVHLLEEGLPFENNGIQSFCYHTKKYLQLSIILTGAITIPWDSNNSNALLEDCNFFLVLGEYSGDEPFPLLTLPGGWPESEKCRILAWTDDSQMSGVADDALGSSGRSFLPFSRFFLRMKRREK